MSEEGINEESRDDYSSAVDRQKEPDVFVPAEFDETLLVEKRRQRARRNLILASSVALLLLLLVAYLAFWRTKKAPDEAADDAAAAVVSVRVAKAQRQTITAEVSALGTIYPHEQVTVSPKISAQIKQLPSLQNKVVRAGEVIAVLEANDLQGQKGEAVAALQEARLNARGLATGTIPQATAQAERDLRDARAGVANARALYERRRTLYAQGGIALKDVEAAQLALTSAEDNLRLAERTATLRTSAIDPNERALAESRVQQAQQRIATLDAQLSYATIRAPITGIVTNQYEFQGEYAAAGAKLVDIADIGEVIVKAPFADEIASQIKTGDAATIVPTDAPDIEMHGTVMLVSRASDPQNRTSEVWVHLGNEAGRLKTGGAAQVRIASQEHRNAVAVPAAAVTLEASNAKEGTVMVVDKDNIAHETKVTTGLRAGDLIEIVSGLNDGETIVVEGNFALPDETKVEPQDAKEDGAGDESDKSDEPKKGDAEKSGAADEKPNDAAAGTKPETKQ